MPRRSSTKNALGLKQVDDEWWIVDGDELYGPYTTKKEAEDDKRGIKLFYKHEADPGFVTIETQQAELVDLCAPDVGQGD